ncbi:MaoC/PaaZ C-terminal domain-containing protein [Staphylococcus sp. HMSC072E01]|uniref:MaoC/PaaZ C-terminal domain-containing protein n=1 Tax=Staphylococcus sp. HMSC072E01 TaxID=1739457 RepID=UPI000ADE54B4|nr:MaoC/PaaZ C-terminal domain-containing protein [Staphylococcus sp. HMSC072E01]
MKYSMFSIGDTFISKHYKITEKEILEFAHQFDPQYMHLDKKKAGQGMYKGIIASGMHTLSLSFKLWIEENKYEEDIIAGTHLNNVTFIKPVYPNDNLYVKVKVLDKKLKKQFGSLTVEIMTFRHLINMRIKYFNLSLLFYYQFKI